MNILQISLGVIYTIRSQGFITVNYLGRDIIIRVSQIGFEVDFAKSIISYDFFNNKKYLLKSIFYKL